MLLATSGYKVEARDANEHPTMHRTVSHKNYLASNTNGTEMQKPRSR